MNDKKCLRFQIEAARHNRRKMLKTCACAGLGLALSSAGLSCSSQPSSRQKGTPADDEFAMIAYCCLECDKCDVYIATQNNNDQLRAKVAEKLKMKAEELYCDGCKSDRTPLNCDARKCAISRNLPTCAHCDDFPSCDKETWTKWPPLKEKVQAMRSKLNS